MMIFSPFPLLNPAALILHIVRNAQENSQEGLQTHQDILKSEEKKSWPRSQETTIFSSLPIPQQFWVSIPFSMQDQQKAESLSVSEWDPMSS